MNAHAEPSGDELEYLDRAIELRNAGRFNAARRIIEDALALSPNQPRLLFELGCIELGAKRLEPAEEAFAEAVRADSNNSVLVAMHATVLRKLGQLDDGLALLDAAIARDPDTGALWAERGWTYYALHRYKDALDSFTHAVEITSSSAQNAQPSEPVHTLDRTAEQGRRLTRRRVGIGPLTLICRAIDRDTRRRFDGWLKQEAQLRSLLSCDRTSLVQNCSLLRDFAWRKARLATLKEPLILIAVIGWALGIFALVAIVWKFLAPGHGLSSDAATLIVLFGSACGTLITPFVVRLGIPWLQATLLFLAVCVVGAAVGERHQFPVVAYVIESTVGMGLVTVLSLSAVVAVLDGIEAFAAGQLRRRHRKAAVLAPLLDLLVTLEERKTSRRAPRLGTGVRLIEQAATACRGYLQYAAQAGDPRSDAWMVERANGVAAAMRDLKKCLLNPSASTVETLDRRIRRDTVNVAHEQWRALPWVDPAPIAIDRRRLLGLTIVRNLLVGLTPLAALVTLELVGVISLEGGTGSQVYLAVSAWALVTLLFTLDQDLPQKLRLVKETISTLRSDQGSR